MDWKAVKLPAGTKMFQVHNFTFVLKSNNYLLEVDEYSDGMFAGYGEHSTDKNFYIQSVSGKSVADCLNSLIEKITSRES